MHLWTSPKTSLENSGTMSPVNILNIALSDGIYEINDKFNLKLEKRLDTVFSVSFSLILVSLFDCRFLSLTAH